MAFNGRTIIFAIGWDFRNHFFLSRQIVFSSSVIPPFYKIRISTLLLTGEIREVSHLKSDDVGWQLICGHETEMSTSFLDRLCGDNSQITHQIQKWNYKHCSWFSSNYSRPLSIEKENDLQEKTDASPGVPGPRRKAYESGGIQQTELLMNWFSAIFFPLKPLSTQIHKYDRCVWWRYVLPGIELIVARIFVLYDCTWIYGCCNE